MAETAPPARPAAPFDAGDTTMCSGRTTIVIAGIATKDGTWHADWTRR